MYQLDDVDRQILTLLGENSRYTATELAERVGVSDNTIHNRIDRLEEAEVITKYTTTIDHDETGLSLYFLFICTVRIVEREEAARQVLSIPSVVEVTELMTGQRNLHIKAYGVEDEDITDVARQIDEFGVEINDEILIRTEHDKHLDYTVIEEMLPE